MKNFDEWTFLKKNLDERKINFYFKERDVRWGHIGLNIGKEIDGKSKYYSRPVSVIKKLNKHTCLVVPFTKTKKDGDNIRNIIFQNNIQKINLSQIRVISSKRLNKLIGKIDKKVFDLIKKDIKNIFF